jgi:hypothetical protein
LTQGSKKRYNTEETTNKGERMNELETLKKQIETLEHKALVYFNELGDKEAYEALKTRINELNAKVLDLMVGEQENERKAALIA